MVDIARNDQTADVNHPAPWPAVGLVPPVETGPQHARSRHSAPDADAPPEGRADGPPDGRADGLPEGRAARRRSTPEPVAEPPAAARYVLAGIRLALGWVFLWAFLDKTFGLGYATPAERSWLNGGSPTRGFLGSAKGPFEGFYHSIAGSAVADTLFMAALLGVGVALLLGIGMRVAAAAGALLTVMMWAAVLPPGTNPFMDDHLVYAAVLIVLALLGAGRTLGLGRAWAATPLVQRAPWLT